MVTSYSTSSVQIEALQAGVENTLAALTKASESVRTNANREKPLVTNEFMATLTGKQMASELTEYEASVELQYALLDADENALKSLVQSAQAKSREAEVAERHGAGCMWNLVLFAAAAEMLKRHAKEDQFEMLAGVIQLRAISGLA